MLFDHAKVRGGQRILVLGAAGNVGSFAVQLAHHRHNHVIAAISSDDEARMRRLGANEVVDVRPARDLRQACDAWPVVASVDVVIDTAGGEQPTRDLVVAT